ncbi:conjugal transfer protein TraR [Planosporangium thailandense]|uniref:Conjugal transfer protein TraR n=1 Tax=Planosporangium thailandense TaxID=765197 RepID=A0ABX0XZ64_9ACTN|nr:TraR/DksA C4-type zinc finger protein [Planosporangium thailandense]NJC71369.1 conjugal transfer protein TraR [Planosporangium thailandense]
MYVTSRQGELGVLRIVFEEQYERHLTQLALLARQPGERGREETGGDAAAAVTATCRLALAEIGRALRYLEEGRYGTCERCHADIEIERLAHQPSARFCDSCESESGRPQQP